MKTAIPETTAKAKPIIFDIRTTPAWLAWLDETAKKTARTKASLISAGMLAYAEANGLEPPPSRV